MTLTPVNLLPTLIHTTTLRSRKLALENIKVNLAERPNNYVMPEIYAFKIPEHTEDCLIMINRAMKQIEITFTRQESFDLLGPLWQQIGRTGVWFKLAFSGELLQPYSSEINEELERISSPIKEIEYPEILNEATYALDKFLDSFKSTV